MARKKNVALVLDMSGSMQAMVKQAIDGFNEHLQVAVQDEQQGYDIRMWVTLFNQDVSVLAAGVAPSAVAQFDDTLYRPAGATALQDAVGLTVERMRAETAGETDSLYLVVVVTDGGENASTSFSGHSGFERLRGLLAECQDTQRWTVAFVGVAGLEGFAQSLGIPASNVAVYTASPAGVAVMASASADNVYSYFLAANAGASGRALSENYAGPTVGPVYWTTSSASTSGGNVVTDFTSPGTKVFPSGVHRTTA